MYLITLNARRGVSGESLSYLPQKSSAARVSNLVRLSHLGHLPEIIAARQDNFYRYREGLPDFWSQDSDVEVISSFAYGTLLRNRGEVAAALSRDGIESRPLLCGNLGRHPFWTRRKQEFRGVVADAVHDFGIYFPNHANLGASQIDQVCRIVRDIGVPEQIA